MFERRCVQTNRLVLVAQAKDLRLRESLDIKLALSAITVIRIDRD